MKISELQTIEFNEQMSLALFLHGSNTVGHFDSDDVAKPVMINMQNELMISNGNSFATYATDDSLTEAGISEGDLLIVDKTLKPNHSDIVIFSLEGEFSCRLLDMRNSELCSSDQSIAPLKLNEQVGLVIEGVIVQAIRRFR